MSSVFFFFLSSIIFYLFSVFCFFCFYRCPGNCTRGKLPPVRVRVTVWVRAGVVGQFFSGAIVLEPFLPVENREIFYMPTKCQVSFIYYMRKAAPSCTY